MFEQLHTLSVNSLKTLVMKLLEENMENVSGHGIGKKCIQSQKHSGGD